MQHSIAFEVVIRGNAKTHQDVILSELNDLLGQELDESLLKEANRRLWNLRVFSDVKTKIIENKLEIEVKPRWTFIPIAKVAGGGGSTYYAVGAYDINLLGTYTEVGAQYESLNNRPAGVLWLRKPQFLRDRNLKLGVDFWSINRVRFFFKMNGDDNGAFTLNRKRANFFLEKKWQQDFYLFGLNFDYHQDEISDFGLTDEQKEQNQANSFEPGGKSVSRWFGSYFTVGRLNYQNYLIEGGQLRLQSYLVHTTGEQDKTFSDHLVQYNHYWLASNHHNTAFQIKVAGNNSELLQYQKYLGGLSEVRGYMDGQVYNEVYWQSNLEHRFDLYESPLLVLQGAVFTDQAKEGVDVSDVLNNKNEIMLSSGAGIRFISPKIYRFVGRLDFAQTHTRYVSQGISFGIQQFF